MYEKKKNLILSENSIILDALKVLNDTPLGIVVLVDKDGRLAGITTEGDIRHALVKKEYSVKSPIRGIMNKEPLVLRNGYSKSQALRMFSDAIRQIPVVDERGRVSDILFYKEFCDVLKNEKDIAIRARAPLRISFAGGGTDVNPYIEVEGGVVLSTTINKYCFGTLKKRPDNKIVIYSKDYNLSVEINHPNSIEYDGRLDLIKAVIKLMQPRFGMDLYLQSDVPPGSGLGGSATIASVVAGLLNHLREDKFDEYQLAEIAFQSERVELGVAGGWQDQYAAVFGGFNFIEFKKDDVVVHPLKIKEEILNELESNLLLCFTGETRNSGEIVKSQTDSYLSSNRVVAEALKETGDFAIQIKNTLLKGDLKRFGQLLHEAWLAKKRFDKKVSTPRIDKLYENGLRAGAIGGKVLGAGGGGYILFFCPHMEKSNIADSLESNGGRIMDFNFDFRGLQTWAIQDI
jgi:D-glycero-alpha-D-manno-heptose-7-phosphate kinase